MWPVSQEVCDASLNEWKVREETAESMIPLIGGLYRKNSVVLSVYGRAIINRSVIDILKAHRFVRQVESQELSVLDTFPILNIISDLGLTCCHIDIGKLAVKFSKEGRGASLKDFIEAQLQNLITQGSQCKEGDDVVLYGFG
ncbi:MAG: glyceraldehyde-3-phosphate dehydrogenase, partial [Bermanella sp.]